MKVGLLIKENQEQDEREWIEEEDGNESRCLTVWLMRFMA